MAPKVLLFYGALLYDPFKNQISLTQLLISLFGGAIAIFGSKTNHLFNICTRVAHTLNSVVLLDSKCKKNHKGFLL